METQKSNFNRILLVVLVFLYIATIAAFTYANYRADPLNSTVGNMLINGLILSIPLVLLYGGIYVLVVAWREHKATGRVNARLAKVIHWAPRIAAIMIIFFISLFSLDVFGQGGSIWETLLAFLMHNLPSLLLVGLLLIAWKRPAVGFYAFIAAALLFVLRTGFSFYTLGNLLIFTLPLLLVGLLFYADWKWLKPPADQPPVVLEPQ